jgi:hypothetical protein
LLLLAISGVVVFGKRARSWRGRSARPKLAATAIAAAFLPLSHLVEGFQTRLFLH